MPDKRTSRSACCIAVCEEARPWHARHTAKRPAAKSPALASSVARGERRGDTGGQAARPHVPPGSRRLLPDLVAAAAGAGFPSHDRLRRDPRHQGCRRQNQAVVADIIETTGGKVDVLAVTHEHYDHVAGFVLADDLFAAPGDRADPKKLAVRRGLVRLDRGPEGHAGRRNCARAAPTRLRRFPPWCSGCTASAPPADCPRRSDSLRFFGIGSDGKKVGDTAQAMINAKGFAAKVSYRTPGEKIDLPHGFRGHVLRPRPAEGREEPQEDRFHDRGVPSWA